ncbi:MAG TPA: SMI1/KNR4 family protein [Gemmataceae bacterium]|nr:SMI1/KNR4 family protein [Gemmataceae bacterium]
MEQSNTAQPIEDLRRILGEKFGDLQSLYSRQIHGGRLLYPPTSETVVDEAEEDLGFPLPALLRAIYTRIGNGGLALWLMGLDGGQRSELTFNQRTIVEAYRACVGFGRGEDGREPWPQRLVPIYDGLGCGMVDYVDCNTLGGVIWRMVVSPFSGRPALEKMP